MVGRNNHGPSKDVVHEEARQPTRRRRRGGRRRGGLKRRMGRAVVYSHNTLKYSLDLKGLTEM